LPLQRRLLVLKLLPRRLPLLFMVLLLLPLLLLRILLQRPPLLSRPLLLKAYLPLRLLFHLLSRLLLLLRLLLLQKPLLLCELFLLLLLKIPLILNSRLQLLHLLPPPLSQALLSLPLLELGKLTQRVLLGMPNLFVPMKVTIGHQVLLQAQKWYPLLQEFKPLPLVFSLTVSRPQLLKS
ncbi:hypothetical protein AWRI1631_47460, partial [Saccharomyces cerevisiae AWRI1631]